MRRLLALLLALPGLVLAEPSPYAGEQHRPIKALSAQRVEGLLAGAGLGYAKAAELNHYPGPRHVLELAEQLSLSESQVEQTRAIEARMSGRAREIGQQIVALETELDRAFANGNIGPDRLESLVSRIARLTGELRMAHLGAHLEQRAILTDKQVSLYDRLRGYAQGHATHAH
ncbi:MAG: hypothetical protein HKN58_09565 [Xanthomonadales bacterium]|nr:hypothetical protein [Xanthomonadales bacterium]